jgi:hypothetical protein
VQAAGKNIITGLSTVCFLLLFFNSGMVPIGVFPGWLQPVVRAHALAGVAVGGVGGWSRRGVRSDRGARLPRRSRIRQVAPGALGPSGPDFVLEPRAWRSWPAGCCSGRPTTRRR